MESHSQVVTRDERPIRFLFENSMFLIFGTVVALIWANFSPQTHDYFFNQFELKSMFGPTVAAHSEPHDSKPHDATEPHDADDQGDTAAKTSPDAAAGNDQQATQDDQSGEDHQGGDSGGDDHAAADEHHDDSHGHHGITLHFIINDVLMALFFAIAGKEVWESLLPGGALANPRKAAMPLLATLGGIIGPVALYLGGAFATGTMEELGRGWAIPCATDIAFSYLIARLIFGPGHPAIAFLLLLAIADDAAGLVIIAVFYPQGDLQLSWLLLSLGGIFVAIIMRRAKIHSFWWYLLIPGIMSWISFYMANIHPALGLVPIIPFMPHAKSDLGVFARAEWQRHDTLNEFEHWWKNPVEVILGLFGLCNAGVMFSSVGTGTWLVTVGLIIGKPLGVLACVWVGDKLLRLQIPEGMDYRHVLTLGCIAGIGFTVALFVSTAAFPTGDPAYAATLSAVKMGALLSFFASVVAFLVAFMCGIRPNQHVGQSQSE